MIVDRTHDRPSDTPKPPKDRSGEDEGSVPVEGNDEGPKKDQKPVDR